MEVVEESRRANPLVSVVVPNYNYARYLEQRMESILDQTFKDFEIILLDDASTDGSVEVLERYKGLGCVSRMVVNEENTGNPFVQWMRGIRLAKGKYVWIAEADDLSCPDFLETCVGWAEKEPDVSVCHVGSKVIDAEGDVERGDVNRWGRRQGAASFDGTLYAERNLYWRNYIRNASGAIFRREYALSLQSCPFWEMRYVGDWMFWFEMSLKGKVVEVYKELNLFRQHPGKVTVASARRGEGVREDIRVVGHMERRLPPLPIYKMRLRRGLLYRKIHRLHLARPVRRSLYAYLFDTLGSSVSDHYIERANQILRFFNPALTTARRERL